MNKIINDIKEKGFSLYDGNIYDLTIKEIINFQESYFRLEKDPYFDNRFRAYSKMEYIDNNCNILANNEYMQSKKYNQDDGDKIRIFNKIEKEIIGSNIIQKVVETNVNISKKLGVLNFSKKITIGLHQVRYYGNIKNPSYSSPIGLHKDDEQIVFIHHINSTQNLIGGENNISYNGHNIDYIYNLINPMETLIVTQKYFHSVNPIGSNSNSYAYRDILLVTFSEN